MRNIPSVSETMEIPSRASVQNTMFMRSMLLHILIALISEKTLEQRKRQEAHRTYTDFKSDGTLIESGKIENLKVKELGFYLKEHGLTTIGRKLDKVKAIRCHYYRHIKESVNTGESCSAKGESDGESGDEEYEEELDSEEDENDNEFVFNDFWMRRVTLHRQFSSYQMTKYVKWLFKVHKT